MLDLETSGGLSQSALARWTQAWLDEVQARTGVSGLIYASPSFWKSKVGDTSSFAGSGHRLWIAHWTKNAVADGSCGELGRLRLDVLAMDATARRSRASSTAPTATG